LPDPMSPVSKVFAPSRRSVHTRPSNVPQFKSSKRWSR
jgi:hypothetical protein